MTAPSPEAIAAALGRFPPTAEQSRVISAPLAPALVVAGAGSGKTETMAARVVWLVAGGFVRRDEVLGLTFTRKAAGELGERIRQRLARLDEFERRGLVPHLPRLHAAGELDVFGALERAGAPESARRARLDALARLVGADGGPDEASDALLDRPTVTTYNAFADAVVREHAVRAGRDADASVLSEPAAWLLMRRVVFDSDDPRLDLRDEAVRTIVDAALRIARDSTDHGVDLDALAAFPARFADVCERPSERRGVTVYRAVAEAATRVGGLEVLACLAREYRDRKRRLGVIDFADQVAGAHELVRGHAAVAAELRDRYRVVLLDEYQDTSVAQTELLAAAFAGTAVMAVGDPHQSIYGWRGASAGNLDGFPDAFRAGLESGAESEDAACARYTLLTSWRNGVGVLRAAEAVLAPLASGHSVEPLRARPDAPQGSVEIVVADDLDAEADRVAEWFARLRAERAQAGATATGAILFRGKRHMGRFAEALGRRGVPHRVLGLGGLLSTPEVVDVVAALRVLSDPRAGSALIRLLAGPRWAIGLADLRALGDLARRIARHDAALQPLAPELVGRGEDRGVLVEALEFVLRHPADHGWLAGLTAQGRERLREAGAVFAGLRRSVGLPIPELVRAIVDELNLDIELAANEARGPVRVAGDQLRAFVDELQGFLATDESGSLSNLLAWLDRAERLDEFAPRTEPPEDDVVQLLTIHGAKGLEWDAVAIVRCVEDELPARFADGRGWLGFGVLPYEFRGDARWLPRLRWERAEAPTQQDLKAAFEDFAGALRDRRIEEERRLAYVAVTRARERLLLSAAPWAGTKRPRPPSRFLAEIAGALGLPAVADTVTAENPYADRRQTLRWPLDPLGARREVVRAAAAAVRRAQEAAPAEPDRDLELLLAERAAHRPERHAAAPTRIPASRYKEFAADLDGAVAALARPMPERPYRQTRLGTLFHAWVEQRSGLTGGRASLDDPLWQGEDDAAGDAEALEGLIRTFLASEWGRLQPLEVETEIDFTTDDLLGDGRPHVVICKLDAVYRRHDRGGRIEIVDWKTGRPPRTAREREERMLQLELYRQAYHARHGVPYDQIDVALYYVADDLVLRG
ncbi:UvrD-helicase domain-containing protein [Microbacterium sp.]|uniref:UvrD-helicase domain-containing protein n=1 Tax=Microbacterium sp. TaxID=51671 RepID=UPI0039E2450B